MRLIGTLDTEQQALTFCSFLLKEGIKSSYEPFFDSNTKKQEVRVWVQDEDNLEIATEYLESFKVDPTDLKFHQIPPTIAPEKISIELVTPEGMQESEDEDSSKGRKGQFFEMQSKRFSYPLTYFIILLCSFIYLWNATEQFNLLNRAGVIGLEVGMTPVQEKLMFDFPKSNQEVDKVLKEYDFKSYEKIDQLPAQQKSALNAALSIPTWKGLVSYLTSPRDEKLSHIPLFEKIREGEVWRLFTPCLLHGGILHILFNMAWVWILCKQVEVRMNRLKALLLMVIIGVVSNVVQYLMGGPYFIGYSGIVVGLVGFIWMRQKIAPWEGYPLQRATIIFILIFVGAMMGLELLSLFLKILSINISANIANTAHIVGGLMGILLAKIPFFSRSHK
ncbi:MAG TPA: rhomboid family intramembrane serine protease [Rhabdochlamydiaceae bacterium]|nr:rhomboid family intramembrane serine protease [Rhabdochlamydiaceae bacterium]